MVNRAVYVHASRFKLTFQRQRSLHRGVIIVAVKSSVQLPHSFKPTVSPLDRGLHSLPHLQNIVSALSERRQVGGAGAVSQHIWGNTITAEPQMEVLEYQITFAKVMRQNKSCLISCCWNVFCMYVKVLRSRRLRPFPA